ncbi:hypothetical protein LEQ06_03410 [Paraclostridium sp. AKS46]|nr:hypothetical protein [Paraclostridium sp. AKS46]
MENKKLQIEKITDKIEIEEVEIQSSDPCKDKWFGVYNCYYDCEGGTPRLSSAY